MTSINIEEETEEGKERRLRVESDRREVDDVWPSEGTYSTQFVKRSLSYHLSSVCAQSLIGELGVPTAAMDRLRLSCQTKMQNEIVYTCPILSGLNNSGAKCHYDLGYRDYVHSPAF